MPEVAMYDSYKLDQLSQFARVHAGSIVVDVWPGSGDWTRLFSEIAGPAGRVYSFVPTELAHFKSDPVGQMQALAKEPGLENVEVVSADLVALPNRSQSVDVVWLHLFYHDLHTALLQMKGATPSGFNRAVHERLKPGGFYVIVDHVATSATGASHAQSLHRIDPAVVRAEVETAGFVLDAESTVLANKDDPHSTKVFDPSIKGETDRFAYRFVKR
jgi:predicted methyltransferase